MSSSEFNNNFGGQSPAPVDVLRQFARKRAMRPPEEQCELCSTEIGSNHRHLMDLTKHALLCVCSPCSILFGEPGSGGGNYRLVPDRYLLLMDFHMTDEQWDNLMIPVNMVYIFNTSWRAQESLPQTPSPQKRAMAFYPSPAGAMESMLSLEGWDELLSDNPILNSLEPDVEALLINRVQNKGGGADYREHYIVPIDTCFELVGLIRLKWQGLSGGEEVWKAIAEFFVGLRAKATTVGGTEPEKITPTPWRGEVNARPEL